MKKKEQQKFQRAVLVPCIRYPKIRHVLIGVYADVPENETIKLMVYDGAVADLNSSQEKEQVYFDATVLEVKKKSIKVKCSESFDSGIPVDEEFSVTTNIVEVVSSLI